MRYIRLTSLLLLIALCLAPRKGTGRQDPQAPFPQDQPRQDEDRRLPNGRLQSIAIAKEEHERALKDADELIGLAQQLKAELQKSGDFVVPLSTVRKTEDIEKVVKRIRGRLRG